MAGSFWFKNPRIWFNSTPADDEMITDMFLPSLIDTSTENVLDSIILYDQVSRHISRVIPDLRVKKYHALALDMSMMLLDGPEGINEYTAQERCFILLPLRHTKIPYYIDLSLMLVNYWRSEATSDEFSVYDRFINAAVTRKLRDTVPKNHESLVENDRSIINPLVFCPKSVPFSHLFETIPGVLREFRNMETAVWNSLKPYQGTPITISLSGGVDSMVLSYILASLRRKHQFTLKAVHISYNNRPEENDSEIQLVQYWCNQIGIDLFVRKITELCKADFYHTNRSLYETLTRTIRFSMYKHVGGPVFLGHNEDDRVENIVTNIKKKQNYANLGGMLPESQEDGVTIIRPFLNISKTTIYEFARAHKIPHLKTSTPPWCDRGIIRNKLVPDLLNYDKQFVARMIEMADHYKSVYEVYNRYIDESFSSFEDKICVTPFLTMDVFFWRLALYKCYGVMFSYKSVSTFRHRISGKHYGKIILNKHLSVFYRGDSIYKL
jgi:tRNA(Ile)-lysidine synthetase-like protein